MIQKLLWKEIMKFFVILQNHQIKEKLLLHQVTLEQRMKLHISGSCCRGNIEGIDHNSQGRRRDYIEWNKLLAKSMKILQMMERCPPVELAVFQYFVARENISSNKMKITLFCCFQRTICRKWILFLFVVVRPIYTTVYSKKREWDGGGEWNDLNLFPPHPVSTNCLRVS